MNFFKKTTITHTIEKEAKTDKNPYWYDDWEKVKKLFPIGKQFTYLGRLMIVAQYKWDYNFYCSQPHEPYFLAEYADNNGHLDEWKFTIQMIPILLNESIINQ
jgi:hypothetical protein